jgi:thiamine pyrophosphate-dependent acetolactate synthase large subunit-like protein
MMNPVQTCKLIAEHRGDAVLVSTMLAMFVFDHLGVPPAGRLSSVPLMGGAAGLGLGIALGRPDKKVMVVDGDASVLMQLGGLVNVGERAPNNFVHFVLNNGTQFTSVANLHRVGTQSADLAALAQAAGYAVARRFDDLEALARELPALLATKGPVFAELVVAAPPPSYVLEGKQPQQLPDLQFTRMGSEARALQQWLKEPVHG